MEMSFYNMDEVIDLMVERDVGMDEAMEIVSKEVKEEREREMNNGKV